MSMTWSGRSLTGLTKDGQSISYAYDANGLRASKTVGGNTTTYYTSGGVRIGEYRAGTNIDVFYMHDEKGTVYGICINGITYYFICNVQGDVIGLYDFDGAVVARYTYDAWGKPLSVTDGSGNDVSSSLSHVANINPFRYRNYYYDTETGFYSLQSRYYDPETGRFINTDTTDILTATPYALTDKNLFAYCDNNPIIRADQGGQFWETIFDIISLGASIVEVCLNPTDPWAWAGLAGDTIDLIPFVTGVGEVTRAVKTIDKAADTIQIAKAIDFTDDAADIVKALDRGSGFTKSTASAGRKIHEGYKATDNFSKVGKEYRKIKGIRQLQRYNKAIGGGFKLRLELY